MRMRFNAEGLEKPAREHMKGRTAFMISVNNGLRRLGKLVVPALRRNTPKRTGKLARSTVFQLVGGPNKQILSIRQGAKSDTGAFYGKFVREGTRPHIIKPRKAKVLRFFIGGEEVFAAVVRHPGTKPNPYHKRTLRQVRPRVKALASEMGLDIISRVGG